MRKKRIQIQIILVLIGFLLIFFTYFYSPSLKEKQSSIDLPKKEMEQSKSDKTQEESSSFENVKYSGLYDLDKPFTVESESAYILNEYPDVVYMKNMHVIMYLKDGRVVNITSNKGKYNKLTYDCFFEENVKATDGETIIIARNLDLIATKNVVEIYNEVNMEDPQGNLQADRVNYDFETKNFRVSMFGDTNIKMKVIK